MSALSLMLTQAFAAFAMFFSMIEQFASAGNNLGIVANESSGQYADQSRINRAKDLNKLNRELIASQSAPAIQALPNLPTE